MRANFSNRTTNLKKLLSYGESTGKAFQRKLKSGKVVQVKGSMRRAARREVLNSLKASTPLDTYSPLVYTPKPLQTYVGTKRGIVRAIDQQSLRERFQLLKPKLHSKYDKKFVHLMQTRRVKVKGSPYANKYLQYKTKKGYE